MFIINYVVKTMRGDGKTDGVKSILNGQSCKVF